MPYPVSHASRVKYHSAIGATRCASIEPTDEYVVVSAPRSHPQIAAMPDGHESAKIAPNEVATPLPPLKLSHGEKQCPRTAHAATIAARWVSCRNSMTTSAGTTPLAASRISTAIAPVLP